MRLKNIVVNKKNGCFFIINIRFHKHSLFISYLTFFLKLINRFFCLFFYFNRFSCCFLLILEPDFIYLLK